MCRLTTGKVCTKLASIGSAVSAFKVGERADTNVSRHFVAV